MPISRRGGNFEGMGAPAGNEFYKMVKGATGRPPIYATAQDLWLEALQYFQWVVENPLIESKPFNFQGAITMAQVPKMRAMTENAFQLWAGISADTFLRMKKGEYSGSNETDAKDFCGTSNRIAAIIYQQKFEGAAGDFLNANLIGRELGLVDKRETDITSNGEALQPTIIIQAPKTE